MDRFEFDASKFDEWEKIIKRRAIGVSLALMAATIAAGLTVRFAALGLPSFVVKYGGSTLWALMIYWAVSTAMTSKSIFTEAMIAGLLATAVEFLKLYHSPGLDQFRRTLPGVVLLGRYFSGWDILAYWVAIGAGAILDRKLRGGGSATPGNDDSMRGWPRRGE